MSVLVLIVGLGLAGVLPAGTLASSVGTTPLQPASRTISVGSGKAGLTIRSSNVTLDGYRITGPQATHYNGREIGILVAGTASAPLHDITIRNCTISRFGYAAIVLRYVRNFRIEGCHIHDTVYAGILVVSGATGLIRGNTVQRIGVVGYQTMEMNSYGIAITDEGGSVSTGISVRSNLIEDVPQWHGIDTHGGRGIVINYNTIHRTNRAIFITSTTGGRRAADITVSRNWMSQPWRRADVRTRYPYNEVGITVVNADRVTGVLNGFDGWPRGNHLSVSNSTGVSIVSHRLYHPR
jgi:hypothetical protein